MALQFKRNRVTAESIVSEQRAQIVVQAEAMISGAGRDSVEVLLEDASVSITKTEVKAGRVTLEGTVTCQAVYRPTDSGIIRATEARAPVQYRFEDERIGAGMAAFSDAGITHVEAGCLNGRIVFRATVDLHLTVCTGEEREIITSIEGADGVESLMWNGRSCRYAAEAVAQTIVSESVTLPAELDTQATLMDMGSAVVEKTERDLGGVIVSGRVNAEVLLATGAAGRPVTPVKYPMAFRQLVEMPEQLSDNVIAFANVHAIRSSLSEESDRGETVLKLEADVDIIVHSIASEAIDGVVDAYGAAEIDLKAQQKDLKLTTSIFTEKYDEPWKGMLVLPEDAPKSGTILAALARPAVSGVVQEEGGSVVEGILEIAALYLPTGTDAPFALRDELPFRIALPHALPGDCRVTAYATDCEAGALLTDRIELRCIVHFICSGRTVRTQLLAADFTEQPAEKRRPGIVMYWPGDGDTLWSIGRRYRIPTRLVRSENGEKEEITAGKALILHVRH